MRSQTTFTCMARYIGITVLLSCLPACDSFTPVATIADRSTFVPRLQQQQQRPQSSLFMAATGEEKAAPLISGADLEVLLADLDTPLVIDAYATWCVSCLDGMACYFIFMHCYIVAF